MSELRKAAQQALEALEAEISESWECNSYHPKIQPAITALRAALAEPVQNPFGDDAERYAHKLHQERESYKNIFTAPTPRKPLTDEEIDELSRTMIKGDKSVNWLCRAIERAHGIGTNT